MPTSHDAAFSRGCALIGVAMAVAALAACSGGEDAMVEVQSADLAHVRLIQEGYVGSQACQDCHQEESAAWEASNHSGIFRPGAEPACAGAPAPSVGTFRAHLPGNYAKSAEFPRPGIERRPMWGKRSPRKATLWAAVHGTRRNR